MPKMIAMVGLPASGKTEVAKRLVRDMGNAVRINYDDLREMAFASKWSGKREGLIQDMARDYAALALEKGWVPIIDNTNLSESARIRWSVFATAHSAEIEWKVMDTPIETCIWRDGLRSGRAQVGRAVIERMALWNGMIDFGDKPIVIFDIDGTLANGDHRLHHVQGGAKKDWRSYYKVCHLDSVEEVIRKWAIHCVQGDYGPQYQVVVVSGRPITFGGDIPVGKVTSNWLDGNNIPYSHLFMRAGNDAREDSIIKEEILLKILARVPKEQIAFVVDDRPRVISMWRRNGLKVYPARGDVADF